MSKQLNLAAALKAIDGASFDVCEDYRNFARDIIRALAGEAKPAEPEFKIGDIVEIVLDYQESERARNDGYRSAVGLLAIVRLRADWGDQIGIETFVTIGGHDGQDGKGKPGHNWNIGADHLKLIHRPSLDIAEKS